MIVGREDTAPCPAPANDLDCIPSDGPYHSIGTVRADPDGTLWLGSGDATPNDFGHTDALRTYDERTYAGKLLHVDREGNGLPGHAFCPSEDDLTLVCTKLYAKGFRNPYRFALRGGGLGPIVADVGFQDWEEVNLLPGPGRRTRVAVLREHHHTGGLEGRARRAPTLYAAGTATLPDFAYYHYVGGAIVGGPLYPGGPYPAAFDGSIFVGDYVGRLDQAPALPAERAPVLEPWIGTSARSTSSWPRAATSPTSTTAASRTAPGSVREVAYCPENCTPVAERDGDPLARLAPARRPLRRHGVQRLRRRRAVVQLGLRRRRRRATGPTVDHVYTTPGVRTATVTVSDGTASETATVVDRRRQQPAGRRRSASPGPSWSATRSRSRDPRRTPRTGSSRTTSSNGACACTTPTTSIRTRSSTGPTRRSQTDPAHDADSYYEVTLSARDAEGLVGTRTVELRPRTVELTLASDPPGAPVTYEARSAPRR